MSENMVLEEGSLMYWIAKLYKTKLELGMAKISGKTLDNTEIKIYDIGTNVTRIDLNRL